MDRQISIVMCTFNGALFLKDQLQSFLSQTQQAWHLTVSDDGSTDETIAIIEDFKELVRPTHLVNLIQGPRKGFAANFLSAISVAPKAHFCALSDQDDIWRPEKLARAIKRLGGVNGQTPALYCSRTQLVDGSGKEIGLSPLFGRRPCFANALVQSIGGGNTMVMNRAGQDLVQEAGRDINVVTHDWWLYQLFSGAGGEIIYDAQPHTLYRQHAGNLVGENSSVGAKFRRAKQVYKGVFQTWIDQNITALSTVEHLLTVENRRLLREFDSLRKGSFASRLIGIRKLGIERQTVLGDVSLTLAAAIGKL